MSQSQALDVCPLPDMQPQGFKTLQDLMVGESAQVAKIHGDGALRRRIMDMGLVTGTTVTVRKFAPLGDPIEVTVRGFELSLRKADAALIEMK